MELHRLVRKQIKKYLGDNFQEENPSLLNFIQAVSESYQNYDNDRRLHEHAFNIADNEYYEITQKLLAEKNIHNQSMQALLNAVATMELHDSVQTEFDANNLLVIAEYLEKQIQLRKEAEDKNRELALISANATDSIIVTDLMGNVTWVNNAFEKLTEYSFEEVLGKSPGKLLQGVDTDPETVMRLRDAIIQQKTTNETILNYTKSGKSYWLNITITPIFNEDNVCIKFIAIQRDVTEKINNDRKITLLSIQLQTILDNVAGYVFCKDYDGRFLFVNKSVADLFGLTPEEVVGKTDYEYGASANEIEHYLLNDRKVIDSKQSIFIPEESVMRKDGSRGVFQTTKVPIDFPGVPKGAVLGVSIDITDRKQAELDIQRKNNELAASQKELRRSLSELLSVQQKLRYQKDEIGEIKERFELAVAGSNDGIWDWNLRTNEVYFSPHWKEMLGYAIDDLPNVFSTFEDLVHPDDEEMFSSGITNYLLGNKPIYMMEYRMRRKDSSFAWILAKGAALYDEHGRPYRMAGSHTDISSEKNAQQELIHARELAESANRSKSEFLANMSHEIRTPLNGILGFADLMLKMEMGETQKKYTSTIFQSANTLMSIINDVLDFSKIEANKIDIVVDKIDIHELCSQTMDIMKFQFKQNDVEILLNISPETPQYIWVDEVRLRQVLVNLLGNAFKFTIRGEIELRVDVETHIDSTETTLLFSVRDTGVGIKQVNQKKIFEAFSQEDATTTKRFGGTGLGLAISNKLLSMMGSELQLDSSFGIGSTFYFTLTVKSQMGDILSRDNMHKYNRILIVDDNASSSGIIQKILASKNIDSDIAKNGSEAIEILTTPTIYDAIIIDYDMPGLNGVQTIKKIRNEMQISHELLPVLLLYNPIEEERINQECQNFNVGARLTKPTRMEYLFQALAYFAGEAESAPNPPNKHNPEHANSMILSQHNFRILIAEDQPVNMMLLSAVLRSILPNVDIVEAANGVQAIEQFTISKPDLVFMDIQMPEMNGYQAASAIRRLQSDKRPPIIALTAGVVKGERERCLLAGMDDYITKPVVQDTIRTVAKQWLKLGQLFPESTYSMYDEQPAPLLHFDKNDFKQRMGEHSDTMLKKLIPVIQRSMEAGLQQLRQHYAAGDIDGIASTGHNLKGTAFSMSLSVLGELSATLEQMTEFDSDSISKTINELEIEVESVNAVLEQEQRRFGQLSA